jgi:hypothetical protein
MNLKQKRLLLTKERIAKLNDEIILAKEMYEKGVIIKGVYDYIKNRNTKELLDLYQ